MQDIGNAFETKRTATKTVLFGSSIKTLIVTGKYKFIIYTHQKMNINTRKLTMTREENRKEKGEKILTKRNACR